MYIYVYIYMCIYIYKLIRVLQGIPRGLLQGIRADWGLRSFGASGACSVDTAGGLNRKAFRVQVLGFGPGV